MDLIRRFFSKTLKLDSPDKEETVVDKVGPILGLNKCTSNKHELLI